MGVPKFSNESERSIDSSLFFYSGGHGSANPLKAELTFHLAD